MIRLASFDRVIRHRGPAGASQNAVEFFKQFRIAQRLIEFRQPGPDPIKVKLFVGFQYALDVRDVSGSPGNRLHDHDCFRGRESNRDAGNVDPSGTTDDLVFQRQRAKHDIYRDPARFVQDQEDPAFLGEVQRIVNAGGETEFPSGRQKRRPLLAPHQHQDIDVFSESRPPEN